MRDRVLTAARDVGRDPDQLTLAYNMELQLDGGPAVGPSVIAGSVGDIVKRLSEFFELGFTGMNFALTGEHRQEQLERLGTEIVPALREAFPRYSTARS